MFFGSISKNVTSYLLQDRKFPLVTFSSIEDFHLKVSIEKKDSRDLNGTRHFDLVGNLFKPALAGQGFWKKYYPKERRWRFFSKPEGPGLAWVGPWALSWP
jgi:hypothetical protein